MEFERIVEISPAFDKRTDNPSTNCGIGSCNIKFVLKKNGKAIQFVFGTDWFLPETVVEYKAKGVPKNDVEPFNLRGREECGVDGWDVSYHSPKPMYEGQTESKVDCCYIGTKCYYDGSALHADENKEILIREGSEGIWKFLEKEYYERFPEEKWLKEE